MSKRHRLTKHHIWPTSRGGSNSPMNIINIEDKKHIAWHYLFYNYTPRELLRYIVTCWFNIELTEEMEDLFDVIEHEVKNNL